jgi:2-dehydropantoate 2-reductase
MGAGAVGGYFGAVLSKNGVDVTMVARGLHLAAMKKSGLSVESYWGNFVVKTNFTESLDALIPSDLVIHATKLYSNNESLPLLKSVIGPKTTILTLQNGIGSGAIIADFYGWDKVLQGAAYVESVIKSPGNIHQSGSMAKIEFGEKDGSVTYRTKVIKDLLEMEGIQTEISDDINSTLWTKMVSVGAIGTLLTAARSSLVELLKDEFGAITLTTVMEEIVAVGKANGIYFPPNVVDEKFSIASREAAEFKSSLQYDFNNQKPLELDDILGTVVRQGLDKGIPVPASMTLMSVLDKFKKGDIS